MFEINTKIDSNLSNCKFNALMKSILSLKGLPAE